MVKLQCENCFADLLLTIPKHYKCQGCGVTYLLEGEVLKEKKVYRSDGFVENPQGEWVEYFLYCWTDPKPPHNRFIGFKSATYHKQVEVEVGYEAWRLSRNMHQFNQLIRDRIHQAVLEVIPPEMDKYDAPVQDLLKMFLNDPLLSPAFRVY